MKATIFVNNEAKEAELTELENGQFAINGEPVGAFATCYQSVGGPKAKVMCWVDDDEFPMYDNWQTWYAAKDMDAAWRDALSWAQAEEIPAIR